MQLLLHPASKSLFSDKEEWELLESAYSHLFNLHDPLRCNIFALLLRELTRIKMQKLAPDDRVTDTSWFDPSKNHGKPTRKDRFRFALSGYLSDEIIKLHPSLDSSSICKSLAEKIDKLSKFTHISAGTTNLSLEDSIKFYEEIENVFLEYAVTLTDTMQHIHRILIDVLEPEINSTLHSEIPSELDELSSGTVFENAYLDHISEVDTSVNPIEARGSGTVDVQLNYGKGDDGFSTDDNYPFSFVVELDPEKLEILDVKPSIDTSSFYE